MDKKVRIMVIKVRTMDKKERSKDKKERSIEKNKNDQLIKTAESCKK